MPGRPPLPLVLLLVLCAILVAVSACGDGGEGGSGEGEGETAATATPAPAEEAGCRRVRAPKPQSPGPLKRPGLTLDRGKRYVAEMKTSCGDFEIRLDSRRAPGTGGSFVHLARRGFYDGTTFHRVARGFVVQGGDPEGTGTGGPGYSVVEPPPDDLAYVRGVVAMAKTPAEKPGTSGSQFFVVTAEDAMLPPDYALLGEVTSGMETVDRISVLPTQPPDDGEPVDPVVIESVTIREE